MSPSPLSNMFIKNNRKLDTIISEMEITIIQIEQNFTGVLQKLQLLKKGSSLVYAKQNMVQEYIMFHYCFCLKT